MIYCFCKSNKSIFPHRMRHASIPCKRGLTTWFMATVIKLSSHKHAILIISSPLSTYGL